MPALLAGRRVRVRGSLGIVGCKSGHLQRPEERGRVTPAEELYVDVGAEGADEVARMGIAVGDPIAYYSPLLTLGNPYRVTGKSIDNRIGCTVLLELFAALRGEELDGSLEAVIAVQEEVGMRGAQVAGYGVDADYAIVVDTFMAGDTPDVDYYRQLPAAIGKGPVLLTASSAHIGHPAVNRYLRQAAERAGVPLQPCTIVGSAFTDAGALHLSRHGIPTAGLGLARRYSHSPVCLLDLRDAVGAVQVLSQFVRDMGTHRDLGFI